MPEEKKTEAEEERPERIESEKTGDKKDIEEEERAKMLENEEGKEAKGQEETKREEEKGQEISRSEVEKKKKVLEEAVEGSAKRRAPIGGIRVPGFLRVSRSRDKNKDGEGDGEEGTDLLESPAEAKSPDEQQPGGQAKDQSPAARPLLSRLKDLPKAVPFLKRKKTQDDEQDVEKQAPVDEQQQQNEENQQRKPKLINAIKLPLASFIPNKLKSKEDEQSGTQAGLASMETLDESNGSKHEEKMETVKLDNSEVDPEKAALENENQSRWGKRDWRQYVQILKDYHYATAGVCIFLVLLLILLIYMAVSPKAPIHAPIENGRYIRAVTSCGHVEGLVEDNTFVFRGIPYALPPVGPLRFAPPQPFTLKDCWNNTFKAHNSTLSCWQMYPNGTIDGTEDCLTIDIYTPQVTYVSPVPVVVAIGVQGLNLPPSVARIKDLVLVLPKVRQGPLGFTSTHYLSNASYPRSSGNYGLADLIAALKWVKLNVAHFGGDEKEITVLGFRQGATLATALTVIQHPKKLFNRLWLSSGSAIFPNSTLAESEREAEEYINALPCNGGASAECLRRLDVEDLLDAVPDSWRPVQRGYLPRVEKKRHQWLVQDGVMIRESPYDIWERKEKKIDVVIGTTIHSEVNEAWFHAHSNFREEDVRRTLQGSLIGKMNLTEKVLKLYNASVPDLAAIISDIATVCPLYYLAEKIPQARFYVMTQYDQSLVYGGRDVEAILGWSSSLRPEARRAGNALLQVFSKYASWGQLPDFKYNSIGQDHFPLREGLPRCEFWKQAGFVPQYAWVD